MVHQAQENLLGYHENASFPRKVKYLHANPFTKFVGIFMIIINM